MSLYCDDCETKMHVDKDARETHCQSVVCDDCYEYHKPKGPCGECEAQRIENRGCDKFHALRDEGLL